MAFVGSWGTFYHIPKCGGISMRYFLKSQFRDSGREIGNQHTFPQPGDDLSKAFTIVRHPADWLLSYYAYMFDHDWHWAECPKEIHALFRFVEGMFWPWYVRAIANNAPGVIGKVFGLYAVPGVKVYKLEEIDTVFGGPIGLKNPTDIKPVMTLEHWQLLCASERETLERYGYDDTPSANVRV